MPPTTLDVIGKWYSPNDQVPTGRALVTPVAEASGGGYTVAATTVAFPLVDGAVTGILISNAEATTLQYQVTVQIDGARPTSYVVTPTGTTLDLSAVPRSAEGPVATFVLASTVGQPNGVAGLDATGKVPAANLPADIDGGVTAVTAADGSIVVGGTATAPTVAVGTIAEAQVTGLGADLAVKAPTSRQVLAGTGLTGGGDLTADRTLSVVYGTTAGTAAPGNDSRITGAVQSVAAPTGVASTDTATIQNAINAANTAGGGAVRLQAGTYVANGLTMYSNIALEGVSPGATIIQLANSANTDVIQGANFSTLTLSGSITGGIGEFIIRDLTIDGNKANNSGGTGLRFYGYDFDIERVHIRNCAGDGMYTEWGNFGGPSLPDKSMEARYKSLKLHDNGGWGWHNRGPHDSVADSIIWWNNTGGNYWNEGIPTSTVIASGSNGAALPQATINVNSTVGYNATGGTITVATGAGTQTVTYTGLTATSFTGCSGGTGTMSTGGAVGWQNGGYSSSGMLMSNCHAWSGSAPVAVQIDGSNCKLANFVAEGATTTQILVRANDVIITGGSIFYGTGSNTGNGLVIGDANNPVAGSFVRAKFGGFQGTSSATAAVNIANDFGNNDLDCYVYQPTGQAWFGTIASAGTRARIQSAGASRATNASNSKNQWAGPTKIDGSGSAAFAVNDGTSDLLNVNAGSRRVELPGPTLLRFYASGYSTNTLDIDGATGHIIPKGTAPTAAGVGGTGNAASVTIVGGSTDTSGEVQVTAGSSPVTGGLVTVTFANTWTAAPRISLTPKNAATATCQAYISAVSTTSFTIAVVNAPAASAALDWFFHVLA